jgi:glycosyltransferase involved in cell wall biosynthesis
VKIALILPNLNGGGAEKAIMNIGHGLEARGHEVHLILLGVKFHYQSKLTTHVATKKPADKSFLGKRKAARALGKLYTKLSMGREFDLTVSTLPYADEIVHLAKIPNVWYRIANTLSEDIERIRNKSARKAKILLKRYRTIYSNRNLIAISHGVKTDITDRLEICPRKIRVIYNSYPFERIRQAGESPLAFAGPYIIHVGRFNAQKRHDVLLEAFSTLPLPHKLVLLTHKTEALQHLVNKYGLSERVYVAGFQENPYPWIKGADLLVLCSDYEGLGNVLVESLILGTKVVSTDCPSGPKEIIGSLADECLVPTRDASALQHAICQSMHREFKLPDGFAEKFSQEETFDLYEACAQTGSRG